MATKPMVNRASHNAPMPANNAPNRIMRVRVSCSRKVATRPIWCKFWPR